MTKTVVIIPTYNEVENLAPLVEQVLSQPGVTNVIVVDDNSPDGTGQIADDLHQARPQQVFVLHRPGKLGLGTAYIAGFRLALAQGADRAITMDADFSHRPDYIPELLAMSTTYDVVIGSRYVPGGGTARWSIGRRILSRGANLVARSLVRLSAHDCTAGFRCYRTELLRRINLNDIRSDGYSFLIEMLYLCEHHGARIGELPIVFEERRSGRSKISRTEIRRAWATVLRLAWIRLTDRMTILQF